MNPIMKAGITIVQLALISYTLFFINERRRKTVDNKTIRFLTLGVSLDIIATVCMIIGSSKGLITDHGLIGYSSLLGMLIDTVLLWKLRLNKGANAEISKKMHLYSIIAYSWWIAAYITGAVIVALRR